MKHFVEPLLLWKGETKGDAHPTQEGSIKVPGSATKGSATNIDSATTIGIKTKTTSRPIGGDRLACFSNNHNGYLLYDN